MPRFSAFTALRYTPAAGRLSDVLAPPYDVIDPALAAELRQRSPYNAVRLVLPEGEGDARYPEAAARVAEWRDAGILAEDAEPAVYAYRQRYELEGRSVQRLALFGALELEPLGAGVLPHERTHAGPKADRLALTLATRTQLSPVFLLARDPEASLLEALRLPASGEPALQAKTPDGIEHAMWPVAEEGAAAVLCALAGRHPLLIADGHHRYETALEVSRRLGSERAGHVLACIVSDADPGLVIRPTHRALTRLADPPAAGLPERLAEWFSVVPLHDLDVADAEAEAATAADGMVLLLDVGGGRIRAFRLRPHDAADADADPGADPTDVADAGTAGSGEGRRAAARIAAVRFDRHVIRDLLGTDADTAAREGRLEYHRGVPEALLGAGPGGAAFILPPVRLRAVWEATAAGVRLPPKSTYFEPKIPSGLLFRPL